MFPHVFLQKKFLKRNIGISCKVSKELRQSARAHNLRMSFGRWQACALLYVRRGNFSNEKIKTLCVGGGQRVS